MTEFTPISSLIGGILIGLSSLLMLGFNGRIAGISGIVGGLWGASPSERGWRAAFLAGLLGGGLLVLLVAPRAFGDGSPASMPFIIVAGLLVGFGTRTGGGCTSGHGVCGMSRLSARSIVATLIFMTVAAITVLLTYHPAG